MKIYNWIDSLFDSRIKRRNILIVLITLFWIWQEIWQSFFFIALFRIKDYSSLFDFMEIMEGFSSSYLVDFSYVLMSSGSITLEHILYAIFNIMEGTGWICILLSVIALMALTKRKRRFLILYHVVWIGILLLMLNFSFQSDSLNHLILNLHILSGVGFVGSLGIILYLLLNSVQKILKYAKNKGVAR